MCVRKGTNNVITIIIIIIIVIVVIGVCKTLGFIC